MEGRPDPDGAHACVMQTMSTRSRTITSTFLTPVEQAKPDYNSFHNIHMQIPLLAALDFNLPVMSKVLAPRAVSELAQEIFKGQLTAAETGFLPTEARQ